MAHAELDSDVVRPAGRRAPTAQARAAARPIATIDVRRLRLRTFIGFNDDERRKRQDIVINLQVRYVVDAAVFADRVERALDYKAITKAVIDHVENGRFLLLEKLVHDVLAICSEHACVTYARVTIDKPHALRFADSVSLTLEHHNPVYATISGDTP